jgi:hypothetical protein
MAWAGIVQPRWALGLPLPRPRPDLIYPVPQCLRKDRKKACLHFNCPCQSGLAVRRAPCARAGMVYFVFRHHCLLACLNSNILKHESKLRHSCLTDGRLCCRLYVWTWGRCLCLFGSSEVAFFSLEAVDVAEEHPRQVDHRSQCSRSLSNKFDHVEHRGFLPGRSATRQLGNSATRQLGHSPRPLGN